MSYCKIDHTKEDVLTKLASQQAFLPIDLYSKLRTCTVSCEEQVKLNEIFHLLKKYDLISEEEQKMRNGQLTAICTKQ